MTGFITIERDIWNHPLFANGEMTEREAFMWMIARAAWADTRHKVGPDLVEVKRGSFVTTLRELQTVFMWKSDKRVRTFLKSLENNDMIGRTTVGTANVSKTHVTICNYDEYQSGGRTKDAPRTNGGRTTDAVKEQGNKITKEDTNVSSRAPADKQTRFQEFWDFYPHRNGNKKGRADCERVYAKAVKAGVSEQQIIEAAIRTQHDPDVKRGYGRAALPWLNQRGWEDEIQPAQPTLTLIPGGPREQSSQHRRAAAADDAFVRYIDAAAGTGYSSQEDRRGRGH